MKKALIYTTTFIALFISACSVKKRILINPNPPDNGSGGNKRNICQLTTNSVSFMPVVQSTPKVNDTVLWELSLPSACTGTFIIVNSDSSTQTITGSTVIPKSYSSEGKKIEKLILIHPSTGQSVSISGQVTVVANDSGEVENNNPQNPIPFFPPLACNASVNPQSKTVKVDNKGRLLEEDPTFNFRIITSEPAILAEYFLIPSPSAISPINIMPPAPVPATLINFSAKISHVGVNAILFTVLQPSTGALGFCFSIFKLEPQVELPLRPEAWITANDEEDELEQPEYGPVVIEWGSMYADDCIIDPFGYHSKAGFKFVYDINETQEYKITCTNKFGFTISKVKVVVPPIKGTVSFNASNSPPYYSPKNLTGNESKNTVKGICGWGNSPGIYPEEISDNTKFKAGDILRLSNVRGNFCVRSKGWNYCKTCCFRGSGCEFIRDIYSSDFNGFKIGFYRSNNMTSSNLPIAEYFLSQSMDTDIIIPSGTNHIYIYYIEPKMEYYDNNPQYKMHIDYTIIRN